MSDEQRVRTMCGWVGVEISKSRVRTAGRAGFGLYRVRMSCPDVVGSCRCGPEVEWTAYAFTLEQIDAQVALAIQAGTPAGPGRLNLYRSDAPGVADMVPTRWTATYRGRRDLGVADAGCSHDLREQCPRGLSMGEHRHGADHCDQGGRPHLGPCIDPGALLTPRQRQLAYNAEFQAEHLKARAVGLRRRHDAKLRRNGAVLPPESNAGGLSGASG